MDEAIEEKGVENQEEPLNCHTQFDRQMREAADRGRRLEATRVQLWREMKHQHAREIEQVPMEVDRKQQDLESCYPFQLCNPIQCRIERNLAIPTPRN